MRFGPGNVPSSASYNVSKKPKSSTSDSPYCSITRLNSTAKKASSRNSLRFLVLCPGFLRPAVRKSSVLGTSLTHYPVVVAVVHILVGSDDHATPARCRARRGFKMKRRYNAISFEVGQHYRITANFCADGSCRKGVGVLGVDTGVLAGVGAAGMFCARGISKPVSSTYNQVDATSIKATGRMHAAEFYRQLTDRRLQVKRNDVLKDRPVRPSR